MSRSFSIYLDLVRFTAAVLVYVFHSNMRLLTTQMLPFSDYGHSSVIVFFVLSGFVIAYATDRKERTAVAYAASRLSRVYSVVLPTLALTLLLDGIGRTLYPALYGYPFDRFALRIAGSGLMLNEIWFVSITYFSNVPYWSIAYEFWYYLLFGLAMFMPARWRWWSVGAVGLILGPKIMLLLPIWWSGVWLYRSEWLRARSAGFSWALVVVSLAGIVVTHQLDVYGSWRDATEAALGPDRFREFTFSRFVAGDYLLGLLVVCNFAGMRNIVDGLAPMLLPIERPVRVLAGYTFTLYLLHQPLFLFWTAVVRGDPGSSAFWWTVTGLTAVSVGLIGHVTEQQRHRLRAALTHWMRLRLSGDGRRGAAAAPPT